MCIGIPMQVVAVHEYAAICEQAVGSLPETVDTMLVGSVSVGDWLLVYKGAAREHLTPDRAQQITQALQALDAIHHGHDFEGFFTDLIEREPQLPAHLRSTVS